jgi:5,10-methylenetetrahydrofolate reductase
MAAPGRKEQQQHADIATAGSNGISSSRTAFLAQHWQQQQQELDVIVHLACKVLEAVPALAFTQACRS